MSKSTTVIKRGGFSFISLLTILFIGLKLTGHITWSWWLVLLPLWGGLALGFAVFLIIAAVLGIALMFTFK